VPQPPVQRQPVTAPDDQPERERAEHDAGAEQDRDRQEPVQRAPGCVEDDRGDGEDRQLAERQPVQDLVRGVDVGGHPGPGLLLVRTLVGLVHLVTTRAARPAPRPRPRVSCWTMTTRTIIPRKFGVRPPWDTKRRTRPGIFTVVHSRTT